MTFLELQTEVFRRLEESSSNPAFWTLADVKTAINDGYEEISDASEWYESNGNLNLLSNRTYYDLRAALGSETVLTFKQAYNRTTGRWLEPVGLRDLDYRTHPQWENVQGEPQNFFVRGLFWLGTFPKQTGDLGELKSYFTALPSALVNDYDVPGFSEEFHYGLVEYALFDLLSQEAETSKALEHFQDYTGYEAALSDAAAGRQSVDRISRLHG